MHWRRGSTNAPEWHTIANTPLRQKRGRSESCVGRPQRRAKAGALTNARLTSRSARPKEDWTNSAHNSAHQLRRKLFHVKRRMDAADLGGTSNSRREAAAHGRARYISLRH